MAAIEIGHLVKRYQNGVTALNDLSLTVGEGEIFTLLGPNGAGKSTLIHILTTFYKPTSGTVVMLGKDARKDPAWIRARIGCVAQQVSIDAHLSLMENMVFQARLYNVEARAAKNRIEALIGDFGLQPYLGQPTASYSGGVKRRLDIAMRMVSMPKILFLDEPTVGMDVDSRKAMWSMLKKIRGEYKTTIFLTTHYLEEADLLSDAICVMKNGGKAAQGTPASLRDHIKKSMIRVAFSSAEAASRYEQPLARLAAAERADAREHCVYLSVKDSAAALPVVNRWLLDHQAGFHAIEIAKPTLEDVFLSLTHSNPSEAKGEIPAW